MKHLENKTVILLTIDALRPDHLYSYGYRRKTDPNLANFAEKGYKFLNAYTNGPATPSSFSAMFTSTLPFSNGGYSPLPTQKTSFPEILNESDIYTYGIHSNPNLTKYYNWGRGFNIFLNGLKYHGKSKTKKENMSFKQKLLKTIDKTLNFRKITSKLLYKLRGLNRIKHFLRKKFPFITDLILPFTEASYNAPYISNKIMSFLKNHRGSLFLWAHFMDIHSPYNPPIENVLKFRDNSFTLQEREILNNHVYGNSGKYKITERLIEELKILYDAQINFIDEFLGKIFDFLENQYKNDCLIIVTADHGESFYEHSSFGHQGSAYNELLKVPFIMREINKNEKEKEAIIKTPIQLIDIPPTILDYFNLPIPEYFQGETLCPLLKGGKKEKKRPIVSQCYQKNRVMKRNNQEGDILMGIIKDKWKYIYDEELNKEMLFNLDEDPQEQNDLSRVNSEILNQFRELKDKYVKEKEQPDEKSKISKAVRGLKKL